jgi:hypothetical protein
MLYDSANVEAGFNNFSFIWLCGIRGVKIEESI